MNVCFGCGSALAPYPRLIAIPLNAIAIAFTTMGMWNEDREAEQWLTDYRVRAGAIAERRAAVGIDSEDARLLQDDDFEDAEADAVSVGDEEASSALRAAASPFTDGDLFRPAASRAMANGRSSTPLRPKRA